MPINPASSDAQAGAVVNVGFRTDKASATLPQTATGALFNVKGGNVIVKGIVGEVTVIIQNQACNTKLISTPTVGTAGDLCAALSIANDEVGCLYGITGVVGDAMIGANAFYAPMCSRDLVLPPGVIGLNTAANNTGETKWSIFWVPAEDGAYVESA